MVIVFDDVVAAKIVLSSFVIWGSAPLNVRLTAKVSTFTRLVTASAVPVRGAMAAMRSSDVR